jgi:hypothetical protein
VLNLTKLKTLFASLASVADKKKLLPDLLSSITQVAISLFRSMRFQAQAKRKFTAFPLARQGVGQDLFSCSSLSLFSRLSVLGFRDDPTLKKEM